MSITYIEAYSFVKARLKPSRFIHSVGVADTAKNLAKRFSVDSSAAAICGIYHDAYRYDTDASTLLRLIEHGWRVEKEEAENPVLLHGIDAADHMRDDLGEDIPTSYLLAVRHHTLGSVLMGRLGGIIYVSDYTEPGREHLSDADRASIFSHDTLEEIILDVVRRDMSYHESIGVKSASVTEELYNYLLRGGKLD